LPEINTGTKQGAEFTGRTKNVTSYRTWQFSGGWPPRDGWPASNVHTDDRFAIQSGLPARAASGAMLQGYIAELLIDLFGEVWMSDGSFDMKFIAIVPIDARVTTIATVVSKEREGERMRFNMDVRCEIGDGTPVAVGTATGTI
jgi:acyl dehydratase